MTLKTKIAAVTMILMLQSFGVGNSASVDNELAIFSAEQEKNGESIETFDPDSLNDDKNKPKTKEEVKAEEKRLEDERKAAKKKIKEERKKSREELNGKKPLSKNPAPPVRKVENTSSSATSTEKIQPVKQQQNIDMANPLRNYSNFNEVAQAVNFIPLYIPKKFGYNITSLSTIENNVAEVRYTLRWEPNVSLHIRTYKRTTGERLKDISGVHGVKWRMNTADGITTYIADINANTHVAAWAVGNYTFSAYAENLSYAAFYALVTDELVDLSLHYYIVG